MNNLALKNIDAVIDQSSEISYRTDDIDLVVKDGLLACFSEPEKNTVTQEIGKIIQKVLNQNIIPTQIPPLFFDLKENKWLLLKDETNWDIEDEERAGFHDIVLNWYQKVHQLDGVNGFEVDKPDYDKDNTNNVIKIDFKGVGMAEIMRSKFGKTELGRKFLIYCLYCVAFQLGKIFSMGEEYYHGDVHIGNFISDGEKVYIIDSEPNKIDIDAEYDPSYKIDFQVEDVFDLIDDCSDKLKHELLLIVNSVIAQSDLKNKFKFELAENKFDVNKIYI